MEVFVYLHYSLVFLIDFVFLMKSPTSRYRKILLREINRKNTNSMNDYVYCSHICIVITGKLNHRPSCILVDARQTLTKKRDKCVPVI